MRAIFLLAGCLFASSAIASPKLSTLRQGCYGRPVPKRAPSESETRKAIDSGARALQAEGAGDWAQAAGAWEISLRSGGERPGLVTRLAEAAKKAGRAPQAKACAALARALPRGHPAPHGPAVKRPIPPPKSR